MQNIKKSLGKIISLLLFVVIAVTIAACNQDIKKYELNIDNLVLKVSQEKQLEVKLDKVKVEGVKFLSEDDKIATVSNKGLVTAVKVGETKIKVEVETFKKEVNVKVVEESDKVSEISAVEKEISLNGENKTKQLEIKKDNIAITQGLTYQSLDTKVATVSETGLVTAVGNGSTKVVVKLGNLETTIDVVVAFSLVVENTNVSLTSQTNTNQIIVKQNNETITTGLTYSSDDEKVAKVSNTGLITAVATGNTKIHVKQGSLDLVINVKVVLNVALAETSFNFVLLNEEKTISLNSGQTRLEEGVTYESGDQTIASVSETGVVKALKNGDTRIVVRFNNVEYNVEVKIKAPEAKLDVENSEKITDYNYGVFEYAKNNKYQMVVKTVQLAKGENITLNVLKTEEFFDKPLGNLTYTSFSEDVATVDNTGKVSALKEGIAVIRIQSELIKEVEIFGAHMQMHKHNLPVIIELLVLVGEDMASTKLNTYLGSATNGLTFESEEIKWKGFDKKLSVDEETGKLSWDKSKLVEYSAKIGLLIKPDNTFIQPISGSLPRVGWVSSVDDSLPETTKEELLLKYGDAHRIPSGFLHAPRGRVMVLNDDIYLLFGFKGIKFDGISYSLKDRIVKIASLTNKDIIDFKPFSFMVAAHDSIKVSYTYANAKAFGDISLPEEQLNVVITDPAQTVQLTPTILGAPITPTYSKGFMDRKYYTVSETGLITPLKAGSQDLTLVTIFNKLTIKVTIYPLTVDNKTVELDKLDKTHQIVVKKANQAVTEGVTFISDDESVATVSETGLVTPHAKGSAVITIALGRETITVDVNVTASLSVSIAEDANIVNTVFGKYNVKDVSYKVLTLDLQSNNTKQLVWNINHLNTTDTNNNVVFTISDNSVATISATGLVTAVKEGFVTITITTEQTGPTPVFSMHGTTIVQKPAVEEIYLIVGVDNTQKDFKSFLNLTDPNATGIKYEQTFTWKGFESNMKGDPTDPNTLWTKDALQTYESKLSLTINKDMTFKQLIGKSPRKGWVASVNDSLPEKTVLEAQTKYGNAYRYPGHMFSTTGFVKIINDSVYLIWYHPMSTANLATATIKITDNKTSNVIAKYNPVSLMVELSPDFVYTNIQSSEVIPTTPGQ